LDCPREECLLSGSGEKFLNAADALIGRKAGKGKWLGHGTLELELATLASSVD